MFLLLHFVLYSALKTCNQRPPEMWNSNVEIVPSYRLNSAWQCFPSPPGRRAGQVGEQIILLASQCICALSLPTSRNPVQSNKITYGEFAWKLVLNIRSCFLFWELTHTTNINRHFVSVLCVIRLLDVLQCFKTVLYGFLFQFGLRACLVGKHYVLFIFSVFLNSRIVPTSAQNMLFGWVKEGKQSS